MFIISLLEMQKEGYNARLEGYNASLAYRKFDRGTKHEINSENKKHNFHKYHKIYFE